MTGAQSTIWVKHLRIWDSDLKSLIEIQLESYLLLKIKSAL